MKTIACQNFEWKPWSRFLEPDKAKNETAREKDKRRFWGRQTWKIATAKNGNFCKPRTLLKTQTLICKTQNANLKHNLILENTWKV